MTVQDNNNIKDQLYILIDLDAMFYDNDVNNVNNEGKFILVENELHDKIDNHIMDMSELRIKKIVYI